MGKTVDPKCACCGAEGYPHTSSEGKEFRYVVYLDNDKQAEYKDTKVTRSETTNRILTPRINEDNAVQMQKRSVQARLQNKENERQKAITAAREGLLRGVSATALVEDHNMAWAVVIEAQTQLAISPESGRSSTEAAKFVGQATEMMPDRRHETPENVTINYIAGDQAARLRGIVGLQVVDAEFSERDDDVA